MLLPFEAMTPLWFLPGQGSMPLVSGNFSYGLSVGNAENCSNQKASRCRILFNAYQTLDHSTTNRVKPHGGLAQVSLEILPPSSSLQRVFPGLPCLPDDLQDVLLVCMLILYIYNIHVTYSILFSPL